MRKVFNEVSLEELGNIISNLNHKKQSLFLNFALSINQIYFSGEGFFFIKLLYSEVSYFSAQMLARHF